MLLESRLDADSFTIPREVDPGGSAPRLPLSRLIHLLMLLQTTRFPNARRLAEACGVSRRTIFRDLSTLESAGIRVAYLADRQGYQIAGGGMLQPTALEKGEALALLLLSHASSVQDPFGLPRLASSALAKLIQALPPPLRTKLIASSELLVDAHAGGSFSRERLEVYGTILDAASERKRLRIWSTEIKLSEPDRTTQLGVYRLTRLRECWALVGHSSFHGSVRLFRVPWIERLEITDELYVIPPRFRLDRFLARWGARASGAPGERIVLRFSRSVAPAVRDVPVSRDRSVRSGPGGSLDVVLAADSLDQVLDWLICYGDQVEVIEPEQLRERVQSWAESIARIHARPS